MSSDNHLHSPPPRIATAADWVFVRFDALSCLSTSMILLRRPIELTRGRLKSEILVVLILLLKLILFFGIAQSILPANSKNLLRMIQSSLITQEALVDVRHFGPNRRPKSEYASALSSARLSRLVSKIIKSARCGNPCRQL
ncbi:hypothetical protein DFH09DRAFT_540568 [Mycena vulgaris]|nr:hypothetical protein DFH09DRAFT_540568 [Mycena vulgaris]